MRKEVSGAMFIVWRSRPIVTDRPAVILAGHDDAPGPEGGNGAEGAARPAWKPLHCTHKGPGRVAHRPLLMRSERTGARVRQRLLHRFPTIRSCCLKEPFLRAAWWHDVGQQIARREQDVDGLMARDKWAIMDALRKVVAPPTRRGIEEFTAYRLHKEEERREEEKVVREALGREEERRRKEEQARRREEADRAERERAEAARRHEEARRAQEEQARRRREEQGRARRPRPAPEWWLVLGVPMSATPVQIKEAYRALAKRHHPDRGGDAEVFKKVNAAFQQASRAFGGRL